MWRGARFEKYGKGIVKLSEAPEAKGGANRNREKLTQDDLELIEALKVRRGSITLQEICDELEAIGDFEFSMEIFLRAQYVES